MLAYISNTVSVLASADNEIIRLVVILLVAFGSAIAGWIKKRQEQSSEPGKTPPPAPRPQEPQRRWPPAESTTGPTIPGPARPVPQRRPDQPTSHPTVQRPPVATPAPAEESMRQRAERIEAEMRRRAEQVGPQMQQKSSQTRQEAQDKIDKIRAKSMANERIRLAAEKARRAVQAATAAEADAAALKIDQSARHNIPGDQQGQSREMPEQLKKLLGPPGWRAAIIMSEILSPPVGLRREQLRG